MPPFNPTEREPPVEPLTEILRRNLTKKSYKVMEGSPYWAKFAFSLRALRKAESGGRRKNIIAKMNQSEFTELCNCLALALEEVVHSRSDFNKRAFLENAGVTASNRNER